MKKPSLLELIKTTFYIGVIGYGGPAILAQMKKSFVHEKEWISEKEFMESLSVAQMLPGATSVSIIGYIGFKLHKFWGGILASLFYILPAFILMIVLSWAYFRFGNISFIKALFIGLGALVVALLSNATKILGQSVFKKITVKDGRGIVISLLTFIGIFFLKINAIWLILLAGIFGFVFYYFTKEFKDKKVLQEQSVLPMRGQLKRDQITTLDLIPVAVVALIFAVALMISSVRVIVTTFWGIGLFSFGGGFTAIPLIQHQVVDALHWLTIPQFMDGIAMGQITPGPVFITATFIGYRVAGVLGAIVATLAIFTPSLALMIGLTDIHAKVSNLKIMKVFVKGFLAGFIGLLVAVTMQFALKSLINWQTWMIFGTSLVWLMYLKKDAIWAIVGTMVLSLLIF